MIAIFTSQIGPHCIRINLRGPTSQNVPDEPGLEGTEPEVASLVSPARDQSKLQTLHGWSSPSVLVKMYHPYKGIIDAIFPGKRYHHLSEMQP